MKETMRYELLIIFCVSSLNSLTVERRLNDRIFSVLENKCENIFHGDEEEDDICECSEDKNTFLSTHKGHYSCSNKLGRLLQFLKLVLFANNNGVLTIRKIPLAGPNVNFNNDCIKYEYSQFTPCDKAD